MKKIVYGSGIAALVCAERLSLQGQEVLLLAPNEYYGGHFRGIEIHDTHFEIGMNLLEFSSYQQDGNPSVQSYDPKVKNDSGRFVKHVENYICNDLKTTCIETPRLQAYYEESWLDDFFISDYFNALAQLPDELNKALLAELLDLKISPSLHPRTKNTSQDFLKASLEQVSVANHGKGFHEKFIEPFCEKLTNKSTADLLAIYHRLTWLPVIYPETLKSGLQNESDCKPVQFHTPKTGGLLTIIDVLVDKLTESQVLSSGKILESSLKLNSDGSVEFSTEDGEDYITDQLIWAESLQSLHSALGLSAKAFESANICCSFLSVDTGYVQKPISSAFIVNPHITCYRVTNFDMCSNTTTPFTRLCLEYNTDYLKGKEPNPIADLVQLGLLKDGSGVEFCESKAFSNALLLPTPANYEHFQSLEKNVRDMPIQRMGSSAAFSSSSFNDQVVQGLKAAEVSL